MVKRDIKMNLGVALDIGTTTLVGALVDLDTREPLDCFSLRNPQTAWGEDILSRINAVKEDPSLTLILQKAVVEGINEIISKLPDGASIVELVAAGNTTMEHILLGVSPAPLGEVPYRPVFKEARNTPAGNIGIAASRDANLYTFPIIGGFVGGDTVAVILSAGIHGTSSPSLAIDIGTNSEIVVASGDDLFVTSAAAGPAFEGGEISCGMVAQDGAIDGVSIKGDRVTFGVIGGVSPRGLCGSGLLNVVSQLVVHDVIDGSGRIKGPEDIDNNLANRIKRLKDGNSFLLYRDVRRELVLTQSDVRALQFAKSAIRAGISVLLKKAGIGPEGIDKVYIAGAFGSHISEEDLLNIGLLDRMWKGKVLFLGDAALEGAVDALCSKEKRVEAEDIASAARYVSLSGSSHFEKAFMRYMDFPGLS